MTGDDSGQEKNLTGFRFVIVCPHVIPASPNDSSKYGAVRYLSIYNRRARQSQTRRAYYRNPLQANYSSVLSLLSPILLDISCIFLLSSSPSVFGPMIPGFPVVFGFRKSGSSLNIGDASSISRTWPVIAY